MELKLDSDVPAYVWTLNFDQAQIGRIHTKNLPYHHCGLPCGPYGKLPFRLLTQ